MKDLLSHSFSLSLLLPDPLSSILLSGRGNDGHPGTPQTIHTYTGTQMDGSVGKQAVRAAG